MTRKLQKMACRLLVIICILSGCGEVTKLQLEIRPSQAEYPEAKAVFVTVGCSRGGCHLTTTGDFKVDPDDNSPVNLDVEYQMAKLFVNLEQPDDSILVRVALKGDEAAATHKLCFENENACGYRKVDAWLRAKNGEDTSIGDVDCTPIEGACAIVRP